MFSGCLKNVLLFYGQLFKCQLHSDIFMVFLEFHFVLSCFLVFLSISLCNLFSCVDNLSQCIGVSILQAQVRYRNLTSLHILLSSPMYK